MRFLKMFFSFYVLASFHVALSVCCLVWYNFYRMNVTLIPFYLPVVFMGTVALYNFIKYFDLFRSFKPPASRFLRVVFFTTVTTFIGASLFMFRLPVSTIAVLSVAGILSFLYVIPISKDKAGLRHGRGLKIYLVALVWTLLTAVVPLFPGSKIGLVEGAAMAQQFLMILVLTLPFEVRDARTDSNLLNTLPQQLGLKKTKVLGMVLLLVFFVLEFVRETDVISLGHTALFVLITAPFLLLMQKKQSTYYSSFWVEAIPVFWILVGFLFYF